MDLTGTPWDRLGRGGQSEVEATRRVYLEELMKTNYKCKFDGDSLGCAEFASEFCPCEGLIHVVQITAGYFCLKHAFMLYQARRSEILWGGNWGDEGARPASRADVAPGPFRTGDQKER